MEFHRWHMFRCASRSGRWGRVHKARRSASTRRWRHIWPTWIPTCESPPAWLAHLAWIADGDRWHQRHSKSVFCVEIPVNRFRSFQIQILGQTSLTKSLFFLHIHQVLARVQWVDCLDSNGACLSWSRDPHCNLQILGWNNYSTNPWMVDVDPLFVGRPPLLLDNLAILAVMILLEYLWISYGCQIPRNSLFKIADRQFIILPF